MQSIYQHNAMVPRKDKEHERRGIGGALSKTDDEILARTSNAYINEVLILFERLFVSPLPKV